MNDGTGESFWYHPVYFSIVPGVEPFHQNVSVICHPAFALVKSMNGISWTGTVTCLYMYKMEVARLQFMH